MQVLEAVWEVSILLCLELEYSPKSVLSQRKTRLNLSFKMAALSTVQKMSLGVPKWKPEA